MPRTKRPATTKQRAPRKASTKAPPPILDLGASLLSETKASDAPPLAPSRAKHHDFAALHDLVREDGSTPTKGPVIVPWDERYAHAIERALTGRKVDELLELLDTRHYLHPMLLPALADVIRSQMEGAPGRARVLTSIQDAVIRKVVERRGAVADRKWLASLYDVSEDAIKQSLERTRLKGK